MNCPRCQSNRYPNWTFYAALILAAVTIGNNIRTDKEYRQVREVREANDSLHADWVQKKCVPRPLSARPPISWVVP